MFPLGMYAQSVYQDAEKFFKEGDYPQALNMYKAAMIIEKDNLVKIEAAIEKTNRCITIKGKADTYFNSNKFEEAKKEYKLLLSLNPSDSHANQRISSCDEQIEKNLWMATQAINTEQAYKDYLSAYPKGYHVEEANKMISEIGDFKSWQSAESEDTEQAYLKYLKESKLPQYKEKAQRKLCEKVDKRLYATAESTGTSEAILAYLNNQEDTCKRYVNEARRMHSQAQYMEKAAAYFEKKQYKKAVEEVENAKKSGALSPTMQEKADLYYEEYEYRTTIRRNPSYFALEKHLEKYPNSPHRDEIQGKMKKLKSEEPYRDFEYNTIIKY
jgi:tetratricopeptide (TPR) repeat protein